jgi:hypothetical protein
VINEMHVGQRLFFRMYLSAQARQTPLGRQFMQFAVQVRQLPAEKYPLRQLTHPLPLSMQLVQPAMQVPQEMLTPSPLSYPLHL